VNSQPRKNEYGNSKCVVIMSWNFWFSFNFVFFFLLVLPYAFLFAVLCALWRSQSVKMRNPLIFTMQGENIIFFALSIARDQSFTFFGNISNKSVQPYRRATWFMLRYHTVPNIPKGVWKIDIEQSLNKLTMYVIYIVCPIRFCQIYWAKQTSIATSWLTYRT
jgi:hypothetical protein